jgi:hypothetical protein
LAGEVEQFRTVVRVKFLPKFFEGFSLAGGGFGKKEIFA